MSSISKPYTCTLSPAMLKKAEVELHEDPKTRHLEIKTLRERLEQVPGYRGRTDDGFLLRFLRCKKFDQERTFKQVMTFYKMKKDYPEIFDGLTPKRVQPLMESGHSGLLKHRAPDGSRIYYCRPGRWDPAKHPMDEFFGNDFLIMSKMIEDEETQVCGLTVIADLKDFGWHQAKHYTPSVARKEATLYQDAFPMRFRAAHYLNEPTFMDAMFAIAKPFMKEKFLKRIHMHGNKLEKLHEILPREILPEELGCTQPPFSNDEMVAEMLACEQQFVEENKFGIVDMTIPAKEQKKADATEALGGTFRKLNVD
ncbi:alpha-tocopherol transfer protein-like [Babylonia areolata]|uniref:alpha-tocopherol transfer protein-like n=1 Tax=Babylonia areolata TaxID=304850 RepID=UPI003FD1A35C